MIGIKPSRTPCSTFSTGSRVSRPYRRIDTYIPFAPFLLSRRPDNFFSDECIIKGKTSKIRLSAILGGGLAPKWLPLYASYVVAYLGTRECLTALGGEEGFLGRREDTDTTVGDGT